MTHEIFKGPIVPPAKALIEGSLYRLPQATHSSFVRNFVIETKKYEYTDENVNLTLQRLPKIRGDGADSFDVG